MNNHGNPDGQITLHIEDSFSNNPGSFKHRSQVKIRSTTFGEASISHSQIWSNSDIEELKVSLDHTQVFLWLYW